MKMSDEVREVFRKLGRKGARSRWAKSTPEQRREVAMKMVEARAAKRAAEKSA